MLRFGGPGGGCKEQPVPPAGVLRPKMRGQARQAEAACHAAQPAACAAPPEALCGPAGRSHLTRARPRNAPHERRNRERCSERYDQTAAVNSKPGLAIAVKEETLSLRNKKRIQRSIKLHRQSFD
eukprot:scaffold401143_cov30-Prasinocladus_malaysianus.AAC.1